MAQTLSRCRPPVTRHTYLVTVGERVVHEGNSGAKANSAFAQARLAKPSEQVLLRCDGIVAKRYDPKRVTLRRNPSML